MSTEDGVGSAHTLQSAQKIEAALYAVGCRVPRLHPAPAARPFVSFGKKRQTCGEIVKPWRQPCTLFTWIQAPVTFSHLGVVYSGLKTHLKTKTPYTFVVELRHRFPRPASVTCACPVYLHLASLMASQAGLTSPRTVKHASCFVPQELLFCNFQLISFPQPQSSLWPVSVVGFF